MTSTLREFGDYVDLEEIARGSFGIVYKAWHKQLDRWDAVKILKGDCLDDERVEAFLREARHAAAIHLAGSPHVASVHNCGMIDGMAFIATELVEGQALEAWLADYRQSRSAPSLDKVALIIEGLAQGLAHAHARRIAHHDIKPGNIILRDTTLAPVIVDFGSGASLGDASKLDFEMAATPSYMAPEQAFGEARPFSPESDIYSLGLVMYELCTGQPAFASRPVQMASSRAAARDVGQDSAVRAHYTSLPPRPRFLRPEIPAAWEQICLRCLEPDILQRRMTGRDVANVLRAWRTRQRYGTALRRYLPGAAVVAIVLLLALAAYWKYPSQESAGHLAYRDQFELESLSTRIWERILPTVTAIAGADLQPPDVEYEDGTAQFTNRGFLVTRSEFPSGASIKLRWMHLQGTGIYSDHLIVGLRTSGTPRALWSHELQDGILIRFTPYEGHISVDDGSRETNLRVCGGLDMKRWAWHEIMIVDDGKAISIYFDDLKRARLAVPLVDDAKHHRIAIYNREAVGQINKHSVIDDVEIRAPIVVTPK